MLEIKKAGLKKKKRSNTHSKSEDKKNRKRDGSIVEKVFEKIENEIRGTEKRNGNCTPDIKS
jgi:hypothetical protein